MTQAPRFESPVWSELGVFICTKCGQRSDKEGFGDNLKNKLKSELRNEGRHKQIRVMTSGCLGTCPEGLQAVALVPADKNEARILISEFDEVESELKEIF